MSLRVTHLEKGYTYTASELLLLAKKVGRLSRYCKKMMDDSSCMKVETESRSTKKERDAVKVTITVILPKKTIRAESRKPKALDAIDRCCEKLESQLVKYKDKHCSPARGKRK